MTFMPLRTTHYALRTPASSGRSGQALVEVLVTMSVLAVGFLGIVTLLSRAISLNRVVAENYTATYLAAEGIEIAKNILDSNTLREREWNQGFVGGEYEVDYSSNALTRYSGARLRFDEAAKLYGYSGESETPFTRKIIVTPVGDGSTEVRVNSHVTWIGRGGSDSNINLEDHFYAWR